MIPDPGWKTGDDPEDPGAWDPDDEDFIEPMPWDPNDEAIDEALDKWEAEREQRE